MSDRLRSIIRMAVPAVLGSLAALLVAWVLRGVGYEIPYGVALALVTAATITVVYAVGRALENSDNALLRAAGRFLLTLGPDIGQPTYTPPDTESSSTQRFRS